MRGKQQRKGQAAIGCRGFPFGTVFFLAAVQEKGRVRPTAGTSGARIVGG
ncbi:hypothetical protein [Hydrogeniiclostridium mannosilyticum]